MKAPRLERLVFIIGDACNATCDHCWQEARRQRLPKSKWFPEMSAETYLKALDRFGEHLQWVTLVSWGEPLANPAFPQMLAATKAKGLGFSVITNGSLLHRHTDSIAQTPGDLTVSLDSLVPEKFEKIRAGLSWKQVTDNLLAIHNHPLKHPKRYVGINVVVMQSNVGELEDFVKWCVGHGLAYMSLLDLIETPALAGQKVSPDDPRFQKALAYARTTSLNVFDQTHSPAPCELPWRELTVVPEGTTHPCCRTYDMPTGTYDVTYGRISEDPWHSGTIVELRNQIASGFVSGKDFHSCAKCEYLGVASDVPNPRKRLPVL